MLRAILPPDVYCVEEIGEALVTTTPYSVEAHAMRHAVASRQREYYSVRRCARDALARLGHAPQPIPTGEHREPLWPLGVAGSITHCPGYRAAAVASVHRIASLGIDAETNTALPGGVLDLISSSEERTALPAPDGECHWDKALFSAKETLFKAVFPLDRTYFDFTDVELRFPAPSRFTARFLADSDAAVRCHRPPVEGRLTVADGFILTSLILPTQRRLHTIQRHP